MFAEGKANFRIVGTNANNGKIAFENVKINAKSKSFDFASSALNNTFTFKNIVVCRRFDAKEDANVFKFEYIKNTNHQSLVFEDEFSNSKDLYYIGSDFSGMFADFKTGKIGVRTLSANGFYQGKVTEEVLVKKGYTKKAI